MMTKRLLDIDDSALEDARRILETGTMKDTVNEALRRVARIEGSKAWVDLMASEDLADLRDVRVKGGAWR
jgi:Arc/MetJ family transcription regulator